MQRFWWPGYQMHLLGELQRQQNNAQFCDTLLKTEGISVPTHSCILAALSPYLSQKLSASPSPPSGQKRELQLRTVKAQTLLKLVGLLYSGEMEVKGDVERSDMLSALRQFGILDHVEGPKHGGYSGSCQEKKDADKEISESRKMQDAQVQAGMAGRRDAGSVVKRSCGTGTVEDFENTVGSSFTQAGKTKHPIPQPTLPVAQSLDISTSANSQNITFNHSSSALCPRVTCVTESALDQSSDSVRNPLSTSAMSSNMVPSLFHLNGDSNSTMSQEEEDSSYLQPSDFGDSIQVLAEEGMASKNGKTNGETADTEQPSVGDGDLREENGNSTEKRHEHENEGKENIGLKSLAMMKHMQQMMEMETTQISIKVKLRRRTKGEVWEVVNLKDKDETLSVLNSLTQDGSIHKRTQIDLTDGEPPLSSLHPGTLILQPATANSLEPPGHPNTSDSQLFSSDCFTPSDGLEPVPLPQPPGPAEECDEQIEKLLEDIMMGLNILPNLERDCKTHYLPVNHDQAPAVCQVPVTEDEPQSQMPAVSATGCTYYQDFETHSSTETAQNQPSCSSPSSVPPAAVPIQTSPSPEAPTTISVTPTALCYSGHKLRPCLSPLEPPTSAAKHPPPINNPTNWSDKIQPQRGRPWLTGKPGSLKFPLSAMVPRANESTSLPRDTNHSRRSKQRKKQLELSSQSGGTRAASCTAKEVEEKGAVIAGHPANVAELKSHSRKMRRKQGDTEGNTAAPRKRKCAGQPQETSSLLPCKRVKVSDGRQCVVNLSACSVRLSSNNLLAKERELAASSSNAAHKCVRKLNEPVTITEGVIGGLNAEIRTSGCLKKSHDTPVLKPKAQRTSTVSAGGVPKLGRGRPRKVKEIPPESSAAVIEKKIDNGKRDSNLQKTESLITKKRRKKRIGNKNEEEAVPLTKTINDEAANNSDVIQTEGKLETFKRPPMVTLTEFQKLIQCQLSKIKKSKERHDKETASAVGSDNEKTSEELTEEMEMDAVQPQDRGGTKESSVILNVTVDENHNQIFNKPTAECGKPLLDETNNSTSKDTNLFGDESHPVFSCDVLGEDGAKILAEREPPLKKPDGGTTCATPQTISDETSSASDAHPPQGNTSALNCNLNPQSPVRTSPPPSTAVGFSRSSSCDQEEEEEVEVDVVLFSPEKLRQTGECENGLNMELTPEEEEEEDIDVTGDEAE